MLSHRSTGKAWFTATFVFKLILTSQYVAHIFLSLSGSGLERLCDGLERLFFTSQRYAATRCPPLPSAGADIHAVWTHRQAKTLIHIKFRHFKSIKTKNPFGSSNLPAHMQWLGYRHSASLDPECKHLGIIFKRSLLVTFSF